jgi:hypothetical protein
MKRNKLTRRNFLKSSGVASVALGMAPANASFQKRDLQKTDGLQIPIRRESGFRSDKRGPKAVKEFKFHNENR